MDYVKTTEQFGSRLSFLYGIDVQHLLPEGTQQEVRDGIVTVAKTMFKPHGGLLFAAGNGIMPDSPIENIETMLKTVHEVKSVIC
jgi:uroporphyrinogen decarboxylase